MLYSDGNDNSPNGSQQVNTCDAYANFVFQGPTGNRFNLGLFDWDINNAQCNQNVQPQLPLCEGGPGICTVTNNSFATTGITYPVFATINSPSTFSSATVNAVDVIDADETDYYFSSQQNPGAGYPCPTPAICLGTVAATTITDRNGNVAQLSGLGTGNSQGSAILNYTDSIGRTALSIPTFGTSQDSVTVGGLTTPYKIEWTTVSPNYTIGLDFLYNSPGNSTGYTCTSGGSYGNNQPSIKVVSSITLPNGQSYQFDYANNPYGLVDKITYPDGGYVRYLWGTSLQSQYGSFPYSYATTVGGPGGVPVPGPNGTGVCTYYYDNPAVIKRFVSHNGSTEVEEQDFLYSTTWGTGGSAPYWTTKTATVLTKDLLGNTQQQTVYTYLPSVSDYQPDNTAVAQIPVESLIQYYQTVPIGTNPQSAGLIQSVTKTWQNTRLMTKQQTALDNGQLGETDWSYNSNEMETERDDYDYGSGSRGSLLRKTLFPSYHTFTNQAGTVAHIVDKPNSVQVQDGSGNVAAGVSYVYDSSINSITGNPTANLLSRSNWLNSSGSYALTTSHTYDSYGNIHTTTDPAGNVTTYNYTDSFADSCNYTSPSNAYLTSIVYPSTNGVAHTESFKYYCALGYLASSTDENSQTTSYLYNDPLARPTETDYPSGWGKTIMAYTDTPGATSIETKRIDQSGTVWSDSIGYYDGMFHQVSQSSASGESLAWDHTDTCLDGLGRTRYSVYAYQTNSSAGDSACSNPGDTYTYDALNRTTSVAHSDSTVISTSYTGRASDIKDEGSTSGSKERVSQSDGLGRLTSVCEVTQQSQYGLSPQSCGLDYSGTGFLTSYQYSAQGDLKSVSQGAQTRSFSYDLTSRLLQSGNPESGTVTYTYDSDNSCPQTQYFGELISKTDALGVRTCMQYDNLHRLIAKTYSDGVTPAVAYGYDESSKYGITLTNTVGRKSSQSTAGSSATASVFSYDTLGHVINNSQCTPQNCGNSMFSITYSNYNVADQPASATNGAGVTMSYGYNSVGRINSLTSSLNDANHPGTLLTAVHYNAFGSPVTATIGSAQLIDARGYDVRGRLTSVSVGSSSATDSTGTITVSGAEQGRGATTHGTGSVSISGGDSSWYLCDDSGDNCNTYYDDGVVYIVVNGFSYQYNYGQGDDGVTVAAGLAAAINYWPYATATASNGYVYITSVATGTSANYSLSASAFSDYTETPSPSFQTTTSGSTLTGGASTSAPYDTGTVSLIVNDTATSTTYGQSSTPATVASSLAAAINGNSALLSATASGTTIALTSKTSGATTDYSLSVNASSSNGFSPSSFSLQASTMTGGTGGTLYSLALTRLPDGAILQANDSINGLWNYTYDSFNRLSTATSNTGLGCAENYDRYGNRLSQSTYNGSCYTPSYTPSGNNDNRFSNFTYNSNGAVLNDGQHNYAYDAESRVSTVDSGSTASYVYDADGNRVRKISGGTTVDYLYDLSGHVISEINPSGGWNRGEVYAVGIHLATYDGNTTYFTHSDWLGTERVRSTIAGGIYSTWTSYPFGEGSAAPNPGPTHYTGKERDAESGLDYFGARYYGSNMGRFMSPDPLFFQARMLYDPQSFNLYSYVRNNPMVATDPTGEAIQLTGDDDARKKELDALKNGVGKQAATYLYDNAVTNKDGSTSHYVGILGGGPDGNGPAFGSINSASSTLAGIIGDKEVASLAVAPAGANLTADDKEHVVIGASPDKGTPGFSGQFAGKWMSYLMDTSQQSAGYLPGSMMSDGQPSQVTPGQVAFHELGQQWWGIKHPIGNYLLDHLGPGGGPWNNRQAVDFENKVRQSLAPGSPIRTHE